MPKLVELEGRLDYVRTGRPAELTTAGGALGVLLAVVLGVDDVETVAALTVVVGLLPAAVTGVVNAGGVRGAILSFWRGRSRT
jgi:hypothetical protein